jgi:hypothetical protein
MGNLKIVGMSGHFATGQFGSWLGVDRLSLDFVNGKLYTPATLFGHHRSLI